MKKIMTLALTIVVLAGMGGAAFAPEQITDDGWLFVDYSALMIEAAVAGDHEAGEAAEAARSSKIDALEMDYQKIRYEDLYFLAKIAQAEAGNVIVNGDEVCKGIMEVVLNRVDSPLFPDDVKAVLYARGQYYIGSGHEVYFEAVQPTQRVVLIAKDVLEGDRDMPDAIYHSNAPIGAIVESIAMDVFGKMYFCK